MIKLEKFPDTGFNNALNEIVKERKQKNPVQEKGTKIDDGMGFGNVLNEITQRKESLDKKLETLPCYVETFRKREMQEISEIRSYLDDCIRKFEQETQALTNNSPEYLEICNKHIDEIISHLDKLSIWAHKFSTEIGSGTDGPLKITDEDSIYYVTPSNISLRLKRANQDRGLNKVIQPFLEKIIFEGDKEITTEPELEYFVKEYSTKEFLDLQEQDSHDIKGDYTSGLEVYQKNGKVYCVRPQKNKQGLSHEGDKVNKIF